MRSLVKGVVRSMLAGLAVVLVIGGHAHDANAGNVCNAALDSMFVSAPNFVVPGDATRDKVRMQLTLGAGTITGAPTPPGPWLTIHRLKFDLDCATGTLPCGDQGPVVAYGGDGTITTDCPGVSWTTNAPAGGSGTNEIVFTATPAITIAGGVTNFCHLEFDLIVDNPEPTSGPQSDTTPLLIEEVFGFVQTTAFADGDAMCNNNLQAGNQGSSAIPQCPVPCATDECTDRTCPDTGPDAGTCVGTPLVSQPCADTDGNVCTIAGCEASPSDPTSGVCVQTHMLASDSTPCPDTDNNACTTAGCEAGSCVQTHLLVTCPPGTNPCFGPQCNPDTGMCEDTSGTNGGFAFLVRSQGKVGNDSQVLASFGANDAGGHLNLGKRAFVSDGNTVAADSVDLLINTNVFDVLANNLHKGTGVNIRGAVGTPVLPLTDPFCPIPPLDCTGGVDQIVPPGATLTLGPGTYGQFVVRNGGTLILTPAGTFTFCSLQTTRGVTIVVSGATASTINIVGSFRLANVSSMLPVNTTPTPSLNVGGSRLRIGAGATIQASISAPNARGAFGRKSTIAGRFCVDSNQSDKGITLMCPTTTTTSVTTTTTTQPPG